MYVLEKSLKNAKIGIPSPHGVAYINLAYAQDNSLGRKKQNLTERIFFYYNLYIHILHPFFRYMCILLRGVCIPMGR